MDKSEPALVYDLGGCLNDVQTSKDAEMMINGDW